MNYRIMAIVCCSGLLIAGTLLSESAYASADRVNLQYNVVDTPPRRIAEPTIHASDTATGINAERATEILNSNPTEVVNPE